MAKEEMAKIAPKDPNEPNKQSIPQEGQKLTRQEVAAYIGQLEDRLKKTLEVLKDTRKELEFYQMQDYYQRAQLLCVVIANDKLSQEFRDKCAEELENLVYPPREEKEGTQNATSGE